MNNHAEAPHTLLALLEQAERERDAALMRVLQAEKAVRQARHQSDQLQAYREDYRHRAPALHGRSASIELMRCHQGFMQRLDQALEQQRSQLARLEEGALALRAVLPEREVRVATVKRLLGRRHEAHQRAQVRAEQRQTDEAAQRAAHGRMEVEP